MWQICSWFFGADSQIWALKWLPAACPPSERGRAEVWHQESATFDQNVRAAKRAFRSQGRPVECVEEKKFGLREKLGIGVKSWQIGLKSREPSMTFNSSNIMLSNLLTSQPTVNFLWHGKSLKLQVPVRNIWESRALHVRINPDKTQHYLSVALFAVKGRGQGWVLGARGYQPLTIRTLFAHKPNQFNRQIVLKPSKAAKI